MVELSQRGVTVVTATHDESLGYVIGAETIALQHGKMSVPEKTNIFRGHATIEDGRHWITLSTGSRLEHTENIEGDAVFTIDPSAIVISLEPILSSARNSIEGTISAMEKDNDRVRVDLDCGTRLTTCITPQSIQDLNLTIDSKIYAVFKASALRICRINR
jgi:molybdopterin-binding protein